MRKGSGELPNTTLRSHKRKAGTLAEHMARIERQLRDHEERKGWRDLYAGIRQRKRDAREATKRLRLEARMRELDRRVEQRDFERRMRRYER